MSTGERKDLSGIVSETIGALPDAGSNVRSALLGKEDCTLYLFGTMDKAKTDRNLNPISKAVKDNLMIYHIGYLLNNVKADMPEPNEWKINFDGMKFQQ